MEKMYEHKHGGNPRFDLIRLGIPEKDVFDFSINLNFLGPLVGDLILIK